MSEPAFYKASFPIGGRDADCFCQCQAAALLSYLQETGLAALAEEGLTRGYLLEHYRVVWMLARTQYTLNTPILLGDTITVRSWSRDAHGMGLYRDYDILRNDVKIGQALALWVPVDASSRTFFPASRIHELSGTLSSPPRNKAQLRRLVLPEGLAFIHSRTVRYSQTDMNGHLNNSCYADLVCDAIGLNKLDGAYLSAMKISYLSECMPGCILNMAVLEQADIRYVRGTGEDGTVHFEAEVQVCRP